eukprot:13920970-Alexandrium_andersonii.AAC.1
MPIHLKSEISHLMSGVQLCWMRASCKRCASAARTQLSSSESEMERILVRWAGRLASMTNAVAAVVRRLNAHG